MENWQVSISRAYIFFLIFIWYQWSRTNEELVLVMLSGPIMSCK